MTNEDKKKDNKKDNIIYVGSKDFMSYVNSVVMQFATMDQEEVIIKGRGKFICRCVDVSEVAVKRFLVDKINIISVTTDSEKFINNEKKEINVSTISIVLGKCN